MNESVFLVCLNGLKPTLLFAFCHGVYISKQLQQQCTDLGDIVRNGRVNNLEIANQRKLKEAFRSLHVHLQVHYFKYIVHEAYNSTFRGLCSPI